MHFPLLSHSFENASIVIVVFSLLNIVMMEREVAYLTFLVVVDPISFINRAICVSIFSKSMLIRVLKIPLIGRTIRKDYSTLSILLVVKPLSFI